MHAWVLGFGKNQERVLGQCQRRATLLGAGADAAADARPALVTLQRSQQGFGAQQQQTGMQGGFGGQQQGYGSQQQGSFGATGQFSGGSGSYSGAAQQGYDGDVSGAGMGLAAQVVSNMPADQQGKLAQMGYGSGQQQGGYQQGGGGGGYQQGSGMQQQGGAYAQGTGMQQGTYGLQGSAGGGMTAQQQGYGSYGSAATTAGARGIGMQQQATTGQVGCSRTSE